LHLQLTRLHHNKQHLAYIDNQGIQQQRQHSAFSSEAEQEALEALAPP
jgi:hypothetical protein